MGIASSPATSGRDASCRARNRGAQASILLSVLALDMASDAYAQDSQPAAAPKGSPATQPADRPDLADVPVGMTSLDELEIVMDVPERGNAADRSDPVTATTATAAPQTDALPNDEFEIAMDDPDPTVDTTPEPWTTAGLEPGGDIDMSEGTTDQSRLDEWLKSLQVSLKHEVSHKFAAPERLVNNRSSCVWNVPTLFVKNDRNSGDYVH